MSDGPCTCAAAPNPDRHPRPDAPLPRSDRDSATGLPNESTQIGWLIDPVDPTPVAAALVFGLRAGKTHNEVQALLSVWQR